MRIGIDACTWSNRRGYGRFTRELVSEMVRGYPGEEFVLVVDEQTASEGTFPQHAELEVVSTSEQPTRAASADGARRPLDLWKMSRAVARARFDVFVFPTRYSYFPMTCRTPTVVAFHDATAERHPGLIFPSARSRWFWNIKTKLALRRADRLVTVSEDARRQIAEVFDYPIDQIAVVTEGPDAIYQPCGDHAAASAARARWTLPSDTPLILYVGGISPHKNLTGLFHALADLGAPWHAVLVGDYENDSFWGCYDELVGLARELGLTERITFTGFVSDSELKDLYNTATLFVLPSMSEGFGLPLVEAMACGLPVAASRRNSIPEVVGEAGLLFDPESRAEMTAALARLLQDASLRANLRDEGLRRVQRFSWTKGAEQMMSLLREMHRS